MTGLYVRVKRDDRYQNLEFDDLTEEEMREVLKGRPASELANWVVTLAKWIRDNVHEEKIQ